MNNSPRILIIEDEQDLVTLLTYNLEKEGFIVTSAAMAGEGLRLAEKRRPDLLLLDWMLPDQPGIDLCRALRRHPQLNTLPVIMLTARGEENDRVRALNVGADDYVTKPFSPRELVARIRAVLRRATEPTAEGTLEFSDLRLDLAAHRITKAGEDVHLGPTEFRLLRFFLEHPRRVFSREEILRAVWGRDIYVEPRTVDVHIRRLRRALGAGKDDGLIRTVRSAGYAMDVKEEAAAEETVYHS